MLVGAAVAVVAVMVVVATTLGSGGRTRAATAGSARTFPVSTSASTASSSTSSSTSTSTSTSTSSSTSTTGATSAVLPAPPYAVGVTGLTVSAAGASLPTTVRYPAHASGSGAKPLQRSGGWPLIVFSQGYDISPEAYSRLLDSWAREGYVVAAPSYPYTTPGQGELDEANITVHPAELKVVVGDLADPGGILAGMVDSTRIGLVGHSDGGDVTDAAVNNTCCRIPGVSAAIILAGAELRSFGGSYEPNPSVPLLVVQGDGDTINVPACSQQIYDSATGARYYLDLLGAGHHAPYLDPSYLAAYHGSDDTRAAAYRRAVQAVTLAFWQRYLAGATHSAATIEADAHLPGVATLTAGPAVAVTGSCPGAP